MTPCIYIGESGLRLERAVDFDAVSMTANFDGFVTGRAVAGRHSYPDKIKKAGVKANRRDEVGIVTGNFNALVVPKSRFEEQHSADWAERIAEDLLGALNAVEAQTLWMTHFLYPTLSSTGISHILGILDAFSGTPEDSVLEKVLIDVPGDAVKTDANLREALEDAGWQLAPETPFLMEPLYRLERMLG